MYVNINFYLQKIFLITLSGLLTINCIFEKISQNNYSIK